MKHTDTIVAPITATGGAVAWIRLSGPEAWTIGASLFSDWPTEPQSHLALYGSFSTGDDGLCIPFAAGRGYTGETSVEMSVHGSLASVRSLIEAAVHAGARAAEPGEFSLRAFLNGRIDLTQAEAVRDTVAAQTDLQLRFANSQRSGALKGEVGAVREIAFSLLVAVEASVDFSEEIGDLDRVRAIGDLREAEARTVKLLETERWGRILRNGLRIALVGPPNAGKSSLLNALLRADRAIVTPQPGTTRDTIEEAIDLAGVPCVLIDTAGLRDATDPAEQAGVRRTYDAIDSADVVWYVHDGTLDLPADLPPHDLLIRNKSDLVPKHSQDGTWVSAVHGIGLEHLNQWVLHWSGHRGDAVAIDPRHAVHLSRALEALRQAQQAVQHDMPDDLLAVGLRGAINALGVITGETADADMIDRIFHDFCIGK